MSTADKSRQVHKIVNLLKRKYEAPERREPLSILEHLIMAILADGTTTSKADAAFVRLKKDYYDWNEVRVSALVELQDHMADLPDPEQRAARLKGCLRFVFENTYGFDLDQLAKVPMKEVSRRFEKMPGVSEYLTNRIIRDGLGGTAMPLDTTAVRILSRLGIIDNRTSAQSLSASLARQIPRARSFEFCHVLSELGAEYCLENEPRCKQCFLLDECPTGKQRLAELAAAAAAQAASKAKKPRARAKKTGAKSR